MKTIQDMHYDFKQKMNKIDSQSMRNFRVPEIDWKLNEAEELFIKMIAQPRMRQLLGFESFQRTIDDIRSIVVDDHNCTLTTGSNNTYIAALPLNYRHFVSGNVVLSKNGCTSEPIQVHLREHDDRFQQSPFDKSSFEWRDVNCRFYDGGIKIFTDGTFTVQSFKLDYIRSTAYMHNAASYHNGTYTLPNGDVLNGTQNSELPVHTYREIVDLAIAVTTGDLIFDYSVKQNKINITN